MKKYKDRTITNAVLAVTRDNATLKSIEENCKKNSHLVVEDIKCKDCGKEFKWYKSTLRCSPCTTIFRRRWYIKKDNHLLTPMVIINSKGLVIGEVERPKQIREWFLQNTKIREDKLLASLSVRYRLENNKEANGLLGVKFICYWIMYKKDYSLEKSITLINKQSPLKGVPKNREVSEEKKKLVLAVFNAKGLRKDIAIKYNLSRPMVNKIKTGEVYSDITGKEYKRRYNLARV